MFAMDFSKAFDSVSHTLLAEKLKSLPLKWRGTGGREPGRIGAGGVREAGVERAGSGSSKRAGSGREIRNANFFNLTMR